MFKPCTPTPVRFSTDRSISFPLLQFCCICALIVKYLELVLLLFVRNLSFFWCLENVVLRNCSIAWVSLWTCARIEPVS